MARDVKGKRLLIVESPGKISKIQGYLGSEFVVMASAGHVRNLPEDQFAIDIERDFAPTWVVSKDKKDIAKRLIKAMQEASAIYLATDPDREGEAIAAHILALTKIPVSKPVMRVTFNSITKDAVQKAVQNPRRIDTNLVAAQHARRKLDRIVGYKVTDYATKALGRGFSAGRVQSPALRLVVERERQILAFKPEDYWTIDALLQVGAGQQFKARLVEMQGQQLPLKDAALVNKASGLFKSAVFWVNDVRRQETSRSPYAPFTTSTLQQAASSALGLSPDKTMKLAQTLYEAGIITYMRTDSVSIAPEAVAAARQYIEGRYGASYVPSKAPEYKTKVANAQEAHEAIRPTDVHRVPDANLGEGAALYGLIWRRFLASQMAPAKYDAQVITIGAGKQVGQPYPVKLEARGRTLKFDGFLAVYQELEEGDEAESEENTTLPVIEKTSALTLVEVLSEQHTTKPPSRFNEASLIRELEKLGIGRPSTYAKIISNLKQREYIRIQKKRIVPTDEGMKLIDYLLGGFSPMFELSYTASMEEGLDKVANGHLSELDLLRSMWNQLQPLLLAAGASVENANAVALANRPAPKKTGEKCPKCSSDLVVKNSRHGDFVGCSAFPKCRFTSGLNHKPVTLRHENAS